MVLHFSFLLIILNFSFRHFFLGREQDQITWLMIVMRLYCSRLCYLFWCTMKCRSSASNGIAVKETTLAMIKPDGLLGNYTDKIKEVIVESGFTILKEVTTQLDETRASSFYAEHSSKSFFPDLLKYMTRYIAFIHYYLGLIQLTKLWWHSLTLLL